MKKLVYLFILLLLSYSSVSWAQTTYIVSSNADSGPNTLRAAITSINTGTASQPYSISFTTAGPVSLTAALPNLVQSCTLIGATPLNVNTGQGGTTIERSRATGTAEFRLFNLAGNGKTVAFNYLTLTNGSTTGFGGAILANPSGVIITNCLITSNTASTGGGVATAFAPVLVTTTRIVSNTANQEGGIYIQDATATISNCQITQNSSVEGGGIRSNSTQLVVINTLISDNTSANSDAALRIEASDGSPSSATLINCTITNNKIGPGAGQGAIWLRAVDGTPTITLYNTIVFGNTANGVPADISGTVNSASSNNLVGTGGGLTDGLNGNLIGTDKNPLFVNSAGGNYQLLGCSPAINAGDLATTTATTGSIDLAGQPRIFNNRIDMGAYEAQTAPVSTTLALTAPTLTCAQPALSLSALVTGGSNYTYTFTGPSTNTTTTSSTALISQSGTYTVSTASAEGCTNSATISVSSNTLTPGVSLSASNGGVITCSTPVLTLTASSTTGAASFSFAGPAITNTTPTSISLNGPGTYSVTATNPVNGCSSSTTTSIASTTQSPGVSLSATNGGVLTCGVTTLTLTASSSTTGTSFSFASANSFTTVGTSIVVNSAGTYSVTALNPTTGCYSTTSLTVSSNLIAPPAATITQTGTIGCGPNSVTLTASASGATSYSLLPGGTSNSTGVFVVTTAGTYTLIGSSGAGSSCQSQTTVVVSQGTNAVAGPITASGPASSGNPVRLTATATGQSFVFTGPNGYVFSNVYRIPGSYSLFAPNVQTPGLYTLTVYGSPGCPSASSTVTVN